MKVGVQCPNCISYRVIIFKKLHLGILLAITGTLMLYCAWNLLTEFEIEFVSFIMLIAGITTAIINTIIIVKLTGPKKADVLCVRCGFLFKTSRY